MMMEIESPKLGRLAIDPDLLLTFPAGMPGFESIRQYALIEQGNGSPFFWLQSIQDPELSFLVTDPLIFKEDYKPDFPKEEINILESDDFDSLITLVVVVIPEGNPNQATANLLAPLCINPFNRKGRQVILHHSAYSHQEPLFNLSESADLV